MDFKPLWKEGDAVGRTTMKKYTGKTNTTREGSLHVMMIMILKMILLALVVWRHW
jgi:hypothetical protein